MKVRSVHSRELAVPADRVGALLDLLGSPGDPLWPSERWPTTPFVLEGPLAVGTPAHHGLVRETQIHQVVAEYEPGRRVVFRFAPGLGLVGTHCFEVEPLGASRARLTHTLDCRVERKMLPLYPILIRQHDALLEDILDRAELVTTGPAPRPARWPTSVRLVNALELRLARRRGLLPPATPTLISRRARRMARLARIVGVLVPSILVSLAAVHAAWAVGWRWPGGSDDALAERVLSSSERERLLDLTGSELPPDTVVWTVAAALVIAAAVVAAVATGMRSRALRGGASVVSGVLLARGAYGISTALCGGVDEFYARLDLGLYSPLCLALGAATAAVAWRAGALLERDDLAGRAALSSAL